MQKKKYNKYSSSVSILVFILFSLVLITTQMMTNIYAKYHTSKMSNDDARVASFDIEVKVEKDSTEITEFINYQMAPGESITLNILLDGEKGVLPTEPGIEVKTKYTVTVQTLNNLPIEVTYNTINVVEDGINGEINPLSKVELNNIKVSWPSEANSYLYSGLVDLITVTIKIEQID